MRQSPGKIVILNGVPRAGKSSIASAIQNGVPGQWISLGVDVQSLHMIPLSLQPGIGLRPGGERPDLEPAIERLYRALYKSIRAHAEEGFDVVADLGHHEDYASLPPILPQCARLLTGLRVVFVKVSASLETILERRANRSGDRPGQYLTGENTVPPPILCWQKAVHAHDRYDLEIDTDLMAPDEAAKAVAAELREEPHHPTAFERLAEI